ncbi:MAG: putative capsid assembly protease C [Prokaryotic dsDNA virus sp.]|nr:MAG: putative capsid assembly protease C [Prokaryotic dsDNA virus sp.]
MAHALYRIKSKLVNTPHLIDSTAFEAVMEYVNKRCEDGVEVEPELSIEAPTRYLYNEDSRTGVLYVDGPLTAKPTMFQALCGGTSYEGLKGDFESLAASGAKTVAMLVDSPGGEAYGMMDTANYLRKIADDNGIKIVAFVEGLSASAGYGLSVIADEIIATKDSELGSVGVLIRLMNDSKALEKDGYERTFISAGTQKIPFAADGSFRKEFLEDLQYKVDVLYREFTGHVAKYRNMSVEAVIGTQAKTFLAGDAVELGLADKIMTQEEFYSYLAETAQKETTMTNRMFNFKSKEDTTDMTQLADLQAQLQAKDAELSALAEKMEAFASMEGLFAEAQAALAAKEVELSAAIEKVQAMETQAKEAKELARKEKLAAVMAADKVEGVAASLASLDDTAFEVVLGSFSAQVEAVAKSDLFTEMGAQGVEAEATAETVKTQTRSLDEVIKARLQNR